MAPGDAANVTFVLRAVELSGESALSESELSSAWTSSIGQTISVAKLYEIVTAISARYATAGYALSFALLPDQDITDGIVKIAVVEGYVDEVVINGGGSQSNRLSLSNQLGFQAARIKASRPLKMVELERSLLLLNDLPGIQARAVFSASKSSQGASTLTLNVERDRYEGSLDINNRMNKDLGEWRAGGSATLNGVITGTDALTLTAYSALDMDGFIFGGGRYEQTLNGEGLLLAISGSYSNDVPLEGLLKTIDFEGKSVSGQIDISFPLIRSRPENLTLAASFAYNDTNTEALGVPLTEDKVRVLDVSLTYDFADRMAGINLIRVGLAQGFNIFDATNDTSLLKSRANGSATFTTLNLFASRYQPIMGGLSLFGQAQAQVTLGDPLLAVRECAYGGQSFGRGYDAGALSADHCIEGLAEIRFDHGWKGVGFQLYGFADATFMQQKGTLEPGENRSEQTSSAGGGVRIFVSDRATLGAELAVPLRDRFTDDGSGDTRAFFSSTIRF